MEELYRIANDYYMRHESFRAYGSFGNIYLYIIIILTFIFIGTLILFFCDISLAEKPSLWNKWFAIVMVSELLLFISIERYKNIRSDNIRNSIGSEFGENFKSLDDAKVKLLKSYFECDQTNFSAVSEMIHGMIKRVYEFSGDKTNIEKIFNFIYEGNAKPRILALFIFLCSIIVVLSVGAGGSLGTLISSYSSSGWDEIILAYIMILFYVCVIGFGVSLAFVATRKALVFLSLLFLGESTKNLETVKYLVKELNHYHEFKKSPNNKIILASKIPESMKWRLNR
ncbi:MAG: hypothetical protein L3K25_19545 [Gammaproteobacteria bacterium]|nr:hypothetical protein [Gammaproteobacteria bacterium]